MELLKPVEYAAVAPFKGQAAKEHVSVSPTSNTSWFWHARDEGFCGLIEVGGKVRVKGVFVFPEYRGQGVGTAMTDELLRIAAERGKPLEVLAYNPAFYEARGFKRQAELSNGAWRLTR